jgi:hypothetical protein
MIKKIILAVLMTVFCLLAEEVIDTSFYTYYYYDINDLIRSESQGIQVFEYAENGLLKQTKAYEKGENDALFKWFESEYDIDGNIQKDYTYDQNGKIITGTVYKTNTTTINLLKFVKQREVEYYTDGKLTTKYVYDYEYDNNGDTAFVKEKLYYNGFLFNTEYYYNYNDDTTCFIEIKKYDKNDALTEISQKKYNFIIKDSKKYLTKVSLYDSEGKEINRSEYKYNDKGLESESINYYWNYKTNSYIKNSKAIYEYAYKEINATAINKKQSNKLKDNIQIHKTSNSLLLNFANNSEKKIEIMNLQGKILKSERFSAKIHNVNIENLSPNIYIVKILENGKVNSVKFIKE